jgi:hypothetical protein
LDLEAEEIMNQTKTRMASNIRTMMTRWNSELTKASNDSTVLCHHNSSAGITYLTTRYRTTSANIPIKIQIHELLSDELFPKLKETSHFCIHTELFNRFSALGHGDFPISMPAEKKQLDVFPVKGRAGFTTSIDPLMGTEIFRREI